MTNHFDRAVLYKRFLLLGKHTEERRLDYVEGYAESARAVAAMTSMPLVDAMRVIDDEARRLNALADQVALGLADSDDYPAEAADWLVETFAELTDEPEDDLTALAAQARDAAGRAQAHGDGSSEIVSLAYAVTVLADALDVAAALIGQGDALAGEDR